MAHSSKKHSKKSAVNGNQPIEKRSWNGSLINHSMNWSTGLMVDLVVTAGYE